MVLFFRMKKFFAYFLLVGSFATMLIMLGDTVYKGIVATYYSGYDQTSIHEDGMVYPLITFKTFVERHRALCVGRTSGLIKKESTDQTNFVTQFTDEECKQIIKDSSFLKSAYEDFVNENKNSEKVGDVDDFVSSVIPLPFAVIFFIFSVWLKKKILADGPEVKKEENK